MGNAKCSSLVNEQSSHLLKHFPAIFPRTSICQYSIRFLLVSVSQTRHYETCLTGLFLSKTQVEMRSQLTHQRRLLLVVIVLLYLNFNQHSSIYTYLKIQFKIIIIHKSFLLLCTPNSTACTSLDIFCVIFFIFLKKQLLLPDFALLILDIY